MFHIVWDIILLIQEQNVISKDWLIIFGLTNIVRRLLHTKLNLGVFHLGSLISWLQPPFLFTSNPGSNPLFEACCIPG